MNKEDTHWISAHLFYAQNQNKLLIEFVAPLLKTMELDHSLKRYFFIRYNEFGPHIRLRLLTDNENTADCMTVLERSFNHFCFRHPSKSDTTTGLNPKYFPDNSLQFIPYIPEIDRYGDRNTIKTAELQFESCSKVVLKSLAFSGTGWNTTSEILLAIKMHLTFFIAIGFEIQAMMKTCKHFVNQWLPLLYASDKPADQEQHLLLSKFKQRFDVYQEKLVPAVSDYLKDTLEAGQLQDKIMNAYFISSQKTKLEYAAANYDLLEEPAITNSFIHMAHNRIGIKNYDEAYIIYLLYKCLEIILADEGF